MSVDEIRGFAYFFFGEAEAELNLLRKRVLASVACKLAKAADRLAQMEADHNQESDGLFPKQPS